MKKKYAELLEEIALDAYCIMAADQMIVRDEAERIWKTFPSSGSNPRVSLTYDVGCALIALKAKSFLDYE